MGTRSWNGLKRLLPLLRLLVNVAYLGEPGSARRNTCFLPSSTPAKSHERCGHSHSQTGLRSTFIHGSDTDRPVGGNGPNTPVFVPANTPSNTAVWSEAARSI
jgi:hypothetical protein